MKILIIFIMICYQIESGMLSDSVYTGLISKQIKKIEAENHNIKLAKYNTSDFIINNIISICNKYDVDSDLMLALVMIESSFNENARSHTGAVGLFQITSIAQKDVYIRKGLKLNRYILKDNIELGIAYFHILKTKHGLSDYEALKYYNGGTSKRLEAGAIEYAYDVLNEKEKLNKLLIKTIDINNNIM